MSDEYHVVEFRSIATGEVQRVRGARKTEAELQAEREGDAPDTMGVTVKAPGPGGWGTQLFNAATGDEIQGVTAMTIRITPDDLVRVEADILAAQIEVGGHAEFYVADPSTGESKPVRRIEFADGSEWVA